MNEKDTTESERNSLNQEQGSKCEQNINIHKTKKKRSHSSGWSYGIASHRGPKYHQEDMFYIGERVIGRLTSNGFSQDKAEKCFGVFDGHGGDRASRFCGQFLLPKLHQLMDQFPSVEEAIEEAIKGIDEEFSEIATHHHCTTKRRLDKKRPLSDGSTCLVALFQSQKLYVANVGDSRAVLCDLGGKVVFTSVDQKPNRKDEHRKLTQKGATVTGYPSFLYHMWPLNQILDVPRVNGRLAMSRSIGDVSLKDYITCDPEIIVHEIQTTDRFLILATDGLWDVCSNRKAAKIAAQYDEPQSAANSLLEYALKKKTRDNVTVLVVDVASYLL
jgi:protein phosphatase 1L